MTLLLCYSPYFCFAQDIYLKDLGHVLSDMHFRTISILENLADPKPQYQLVIPAHETMIWVDNNTDLKQQNAVCIGITVAKATSFAFLASLLVCFCTKSIWETSGEGIWDSSRTRQFWIGAIPRASVVFAPHFHTYRWEKKRVHSVRISGD